MKRKKCNGRRNKEKRVEGERKGEREDRGKEGGENLVQQVTGTLVCQSGGRQDGCPASLEPCLRSMNLKFGFYVCVCVFEYLKTGCSETGLLHLVKEFFLKNQVRNSSADCRTWS